jgi:hypothetical protein
MNEATTSVGVDHPRDLPSRHLMVTVLAAGMLWGASSVCAQVTHSAPRASPAAATTAAPIKSPEQAACAGDDDAEKKSAPESSAHMQAAGCKASAAAPERQRADTGANAMGLLLGILLTPRHGT